MNIQTEKLRLIEMLIRTNNPNVLEKVKNIFQSEGTKEFWNDLSDTQKEDINSALSEVDNKEYTSLDDFLAEHK